MKSFRSYFFKNITIFLRKAIFQKSYFWLLLIFYKTKALVLQGVINGNLNLASTFKLKISYEIQDKKHFDRLSTTK